MLVGEASRKLAKDDGSTIVITQERISTLQRIALRGTEAIVAACAYEEGQDEGLTSLITKCYTWGSAIKDLEGTPKLD